ncbi:Isochorismatase hydrolase [Plenodomus tracheiphilus IPT5]|uniref:Isochorismatase hydrolase n=1 Tax=Plenodomus tracheiphilus IPT5 TaxID=1408161 RepID=A0A6A7B5Y4_9PLEO|nr:Isochorismatase hydrolase [Plenodomus tracheiphilus IPT5]
MTHLHTGTPFKLHLPQQTHKEYFLKLLEATINIAIMARTALFVIDLQADLAQNPQTEIPHAERIREAGTAILSRAREAIDLARSNRKDPGLEIVFVQHEEHAEKGPLIKGSRPWELVFKPRDRDSSERLVSKHVRDTFESNLELAAQLRAEGVNTIAAFGIQSECCVLSTCRGALTAGFKVVLLQGAHSTYDTSDKKAEVIEGEIEAQLAACGAEVMNWRLWYP